MTIWDNKPSARRGVRPSPQPNVQDENLPHFGRARQRCVWTRPASIYTYHRPSLDQFEVVFHPAVHREQRDSFAYRKLNRTQANVQGIDPGNRTRAWAPVALARHTRVSAAISIRSADSHRSRLFRTTFQSHSDHLQGVAFGRLPSQMSDVKTLQTSAAYVCYVYGHAKLQLTPTIGPFWTSLSWFSIQQSTTTRILSCDGVAH